MCAAAKPHHTLRKKIYFSDEFLFIQEAGVVKTIAGRLLTLPIVMFLVTLIIFLLILQLPAEERVVVYLPRPVRICPQRTQPTW